VTQSQLKYVLPKYVLLGNPAPIKPLITLNLSSRH